jgi:hypothetical protein
MAALASSSWSRLVIAITIHIRSAVGAVFEVCLFVIVNYWVSCPKEHAVVTQRASDFVTNINPPPMSHRLGFDGLGMGDKAHNTIGIFRHIRTNNCQSAHYVHVQRIRIN